MQELDYALIGARIRNAREKKRITQAELAEFCSLSTSHIGHIERGTRIPSLDTLFRISQVLQVSTDYLLLDVLPDDNSFFIHLSGIIEKEDPNKIKTIIQVVKSLVKNDKI